MDVERGDILHDLNGAAALIDVSADTLRRQAEKGVLRASRIGGRWIVTEREVRRYEREHKGRYGPKPQPQAKRRAPGAAGRERGA